MKSQRGKKRIIAALIILLLVIIISGIIFLTYVFQYSGISQAQTAQEHHYGDAHYTMDITPYYDEGALKIVQDVEFTNGDTALDRIVFCMPINAYRRSSTAPMDSAEFDLAFGDIYTPGGIEFTSIAVNGSDVEWGVSGTREAVLTLLYDIAAGESVNVHMEYHAIVPEFSGVGGFDDYEWRLVDFYPRLAALSNGEWTSYSPGYVGRYECDAVSDYSVTFHAGSEYDLITVGDAISESIESGWRTWQITAYDVRNLGIVMRRSSHVYERAANGVKIRIYGTNRLKLRQTLDAATQIFERMNAIYEYPYPTLSVVMGDYSGHDASLSGIIIINQNENDMEAQLAYLIARQWFGGIVGCDTVKEPWLSEALAQYNALTCANESKLKSRDAIRRDIEAALDITLPGGLTVESEASAFSANTDYNNVLRFRGAAVIEMLDEAMNGAFDAALKEYVAANTFSIASRDDFVSALNESDGSDWSAWLAETLQGIGKLG